RGPAARRRLTSALIGSSVPVVLYAGAQAARLDPFFWRPELQERAASTIGNPIQLGAFCAVVFFPTLARAWALESKRSARAAYAVLLALQVAALFWTRSRGAAVAFAVGAIA